MYAKPRRSSHPGMIRLWHAGTLPPSLSLTGLVGTGESTTGYRDHEELCPHRHEAVHRRDCDNRRQAGPGENQCQDSLADGDT